MNFLNLFTADRFTHEDISELAFYDCELLIDTENFKKGDKIEIISVYTKAMFMTFHTKREPFQAIDSVKFGVVIL